MGKCTIRLFIFFRHAEALARKEVAFAEGKVLVSRLGDEIVATSAQCTHYGAPLAKGVLTADGRLVWYASHRSIEFRRALDVLIAPGMVVS